MSGWTVLVPLGLLGLNLYALVLVLLRGPVFGTRVYRPMILNIGLSLAPAVMLFLMLAAEVLIVTYLPSTVALWVVFVLGALAWLLLLPNAGYLVTELNLSHRRAGESVPLWYDIVLVLTLAVSGVLNMLANIALAQFLFAAFAVDSGEDPLSSIGSWVMVVVVVLLVAFGIYLGRYIRFNSWDLLHPIGFLRKLGGHFRDAAHLRAATGFVLTHAVFFALLYLVVALPVLVLATRPTT